MQREKTKELFNAGDSVLIPATVLRMRGDSVEVQLADGQFVRTPAGNVMRPEAENKSVKATPQNKAVKPAENKSVKNDKSKG
jgi:hypothetical protein